MPAAAFGIDRGSMGKAMTEDVRKLLGGYATGTLTPEEREALFGAALHNPEIFAALADEQALKDLLDDPSARSELLQVAASPPPFSVLQGLRDWFERPRAKVVAGAGVAALVAIAITTVQQQTPQSEHFAVVREAPAQPQERAISAPATQEPAPAAQRALRAKPKPPTAKAPPPEAKSLEAQAPAAQALVGQAPVTQSPAALPTSARPSALVMITAQEPESFSRIASTGSLQLRYTVLLRDAAGTFNPVSSSHVFAPGERARLMFEPSERGLLVISGASPHVLSRHIAPGVPAIYPEQQEIVIGDEAPVVEVSFIPMPEGIVGNVGGAVSAFRAEVSRAKTVARQDTVAPTSAISAVDNNLRFRIVLQRKNP
jgi:hypothetical protein